MTVRGAIVAVATVCAIATASCSSPSEPSGGALAGTWSGTLFQPNNPNFTTFPYRMVLTQSGTQISGTAHIERPNDSQYFADFAITGSLAGSTFTFQETGITRENPPPGAVWCLKSATMTFTSSPRALSGPWTSSTCVNTGTIELH